MGNFTPRITTTQLFAAESPNYGVGVVKGIETPKPFHQ